MIAFFLPRRAASFQNEPTGQIFGISLRHAASHNAVFTCGFPLRVCVLFCQRSRGFQGQRLPKRPDESLLETAPCRHQFRR